MTFLAAAALLWIGLHIGVAGTAVRRSLVARMGEGAFRGVFSLLSVASLSLLVTAWRHAPVEPLWTVSSAVRDLLAAVMLVACVAFVGAFTVKNPGVVGGDAEAAREPRGMLRITRHPMLWGFGLWGVAHLVGNGDVAALLFFGSFAVTAFAGMPSIDAKVARRSPAEWPAFAGKTSILPFGAILQGRNQLSLREGLPIALGGGALLWLGLIWLHPKMFGVPALF